MHCIALMSSRLTFVRGTWYILQREQDACGVKVAFQLCTGVVAVHLWHCMSTLQHRTSCHEPLNGGVANRVARPFTVQLTVLGAG